MHKYTGTARNEGSSIRGSSKEAHSGSFAVYESPSNRMVPSRGLFVDLGEEEYLEREPCPISRNDQEQLMVAMAGNSAAGR
ncbi:MAG: hypothetical protein D6690_08685 [Nitrospirae bacterium]|nr:MAG: hypothetical protein D6690_08685 [Nitrospirota bacterium]